jgi:anti-anti-sigma factor
VNGAYGPGSSGEGILVQADGREYAIPPDGLLIGRRADAGVPLDDAEVSRRHAEVRFREGTYFVADLGSSNGTLLNGQPIQGEAVLTEGDVVQVGSATLTFRRRQSPSSPALDAASTPPGVPPEPVVPLIEDALDGRPRVPSARAPTYPRLTIACADLPPGANGPAVQVRLTGVLDVETVDEFKAQTEPLLQRGVVHFSIEMSGLEYLDSSGLAALVALRRQAKGGTISLQDPQPAVRGIIELTRLDRLFTMQ